MTIQEKLKMEFEDLVGQLEINYINNVVFLSGNLYVTDKKNLKEMLLKEVSEKYPSKLISNNVKINTFTVVENEVDTNRTHKKVLDEINVLYYGELDTDHITPNDEFKIIHETNRDRLDNIVKVLDFIAPIILDSDLKVIDGNFRLQLAKANGIKRVMVVVIDDNDKRANFLRLALNRTAEFQRWNYRDVDDYVDSTPEAQPILEPIGFFGRYVLPESFFSNTVVNYIIDPFNEKQKQYSQEEGLAEWAKYRRDQMAKLSAEKRKIKPKKKNAVSLFDLKPQEDDFLETYDIDKEMDEFVEKYRNLAEEITERVDAETKAKLEAEGGVWQRKHRSSKQVAEDNRLKAIEKIQETDILTEDEKSEVIENIDDYFDEINNIEEIAKRLRGEI